MGDSKVYVGNLPDDVRANDLEDIFYKYGRLRNVDIKHGGGRGPPFAFLEFDDFSEILAFSMGDSKVYVGNLPDDVRSNDLEDVFYKYGKLRNVDIKHGGGRGPPFAFLEFDDVRDAEDAVKYRDGYNWDGCTLRVEFARGGRGAFRGGFRGGRGGGGFRGGRDFGDRGGGGGGRYGPPSRRSDYRVKITGLPASGSWQDLKDHMREAGDVCYADVYRDGTGVVEYLKYDDMKYALRKLDDTKFKSHEGETSYIRVKEDSSGSRSRSRSPVAKEGSRRRSPSYSPRRSRSGSRAKSRSKSPY